MPTASSSSGSRGLCASGSPPSACSTKSSPGSSGCSCPPTSVAPRCWAGSSSAIRCSGPPSGRVRDMGPAAELARRLAQNAEAVCREYLSNGRREGTTWRVGDVDNTPGRILMVRLTGPDSGKGACGHWVDFASGERGDLLDLIAHTCRFDTFRDVLDEARRFLSLPEAPHSA